MTEKTWHYARFDDSEMWSAGHATREQAIDSGRDEYDEGDGFYIVEASNPPLMIRDWIDAEGVIERAEEQIFDSDRVASEYDDAPIFDVTPDQEKDLVERIKRACDEWQAAHLLVFRCCTFESMSAPEFVPPLQGAAE